MTKRQFFKLLGAIMVCPRLPAPRESESDRIDRLTRRIREYCEAHALCLKQSRQILQAELRDIRQRRNHLARASAPLAPLR